MHGTAYFKILDDSAFFAVQSVVTNAFVLTASCTTYIERAASDRRGTHARPVGRVVMASRSKVDHLEREVARGNGNFVRSRMPLSADIGYV